MKKTMIVAIVVAAWPCAAHAQNASLGVKGGLNMASYSGDHAPDMHLKSGLVAGGFVTIPTRLVTIQTEVLFSQKGARQIAEYEGRTY